MTADYLKFEFLGELSFTHVNLWELSIADVNFMGVEHYKCEFYEN